MYGKLFDSMYEGSMVGAGSNVFAVWGYCIAKADPESHTVRLNPAVLATAIGDPRETILSAIEFLCAPDMDSTNTDHEGRRLLHVSGFTYMVVSHEHYRNIKSAADKKKYERDRKRAQRAKTKGESDVVPKCPECPGQGGTPALVCASGYASDFEEAWIAFGKYGVKKKSAEYWKRIPKGDREHIMDAIPRYLKCVDAGRKKKQFEGWINPKNEEWSNDWDAALDDLTKQGTRKSAYEPQSWLPEGTGGL